jgi:hypothetical protein
MESSNVILTPGTAIWWIVHLSRGKFGFTTRLKMVVQEDKSISRRIRPLWEINETLDLRLSQHWL